MGFSDDEEELILQSVTNFHFVDGSDEPISFCNLPLQLNESFIPENGLAKEVFLYGASNDGLQKIYKQVNKWKFELYDEQPKISVFSKDGNWIKLQKPRKSFEDIIRSILITLQCLHFVKKNPDAVDKSVWDHLKKIFSQYEDPPSVKDLMDHVQLIQTMVKEDKTFENSKFLLMLLENPKKRKRFDEDSQRVVQVKTSNFIVDNDENMDEDAENDDGDDSDEELDLFDSVCAICDNGGELLCCEGSCLRCFHATKDAGSESDCKSLGYSRAEVKAIQNFMCLNCQYKKHQCFSCGKLGSSDKSTGAEVFRCVSATCGHFFHSDCVSQLLHPGDNIEAKELQKRIASGEAFTCPVHKCSICKQGENKEIEEMQFAICRRCPTAYHRKCLPSEICFDDSDDEDSITRAWDDLIPHRILIYCMKHEIDEDLGTPIRNHIVFPQVAPKKKILPLLSNQKKSLAKRPVTPRSELNAKTSSSTQKRVEKISLNTSSKRSEKYSPGEELEPSPKHKTPDSLKMTLKPVGRSVPLPQRTEKCFASEVARKPGELRSGSGNNFGKNASPSSITGKSSNLFPIIDSETEKSVRAIIKKSSSSLTLEDIVRKHRVPSTHAYSAKHVDKTITLGKVEGSIEALRAALQKLEGGGSIDDAKAVCEPDIINQLIKWKNKLRVYLSPFLHGMRYTSFGRHFTKEDKLQEIVDKLHWYVQNGDMIVDFCCGANDFSWLMKAKLEETGKKCFYQNYDVIQPKNDFNFQKRDWMQVRPKELPDGSKLVMGLNPPFGVKGALANKFIDKALEFKPKLLILIVPRETQRLDEKESAYDLIWEDREKLAGKSFYLPGSVDVNDKQMDQWNMKPPPLYLWSRPDWTMKHRSIAVKQGHVLDDKNNNSYSRDGREEKLVTSNLREEQTKAPCDDIFKIMSNLPGCNDHSVETKIAVFQESPKYERRIDQHVHESEYINEAYETHGNKKETLKIPQEKKQEKGKNTRSKVNLEGKKKFDKVLNGAFPERATLSRTSSPTVSLDQRVADGHVSIPRESSAERVSLEFGNAYGENRTGTSSSELDQISRRYKSNRPDTFEARGLKWPATSSSNFDVDYSGLEMKDNYSSYGNELKASDNFGNKSYINDINKQSGYPDSNSDIRLQIQLYGQQNTEDLPQRSGNKLGQEYSRIGSTGSVGETSSDRLGISTMQRYAPRLDELNYSRASSFTSNIPHVSKNSVLDPHPQPVGFRAETTNFMPGPFMSQQNSFHSAPMGFAPGMQRPYHPPDSTGGWLNE